MTVEQINIYAKLGLITQYAANERIKQLPGYRPRKKYPNTKKSIQACSTKN